MLSFDASTNSVERNNEIMGQIQSLYDLMDDEAQMEVIREQELQKLKMQNLEEILNYKMKGFQEAAKKEKEIDDKAAALGVGLARQKYKEAIKEKEDLAKAEAKAQGLNAKETAKKVNEAKLKADKEYKKNLSKEEKKELRKANGTRVGRLGLVVGGVAGATSVAQAKKEGKEAAKAFFEKGKSFNERKDALKNMFYTEDKNGNKKFTLDKLLAGLADFAKQLNTNVEKIASKKGIFDTRLQGSGTYWDDISKQITGAAGVSPLVKQEDIVSNIEELVKQGIAYNVAQRGFLNTIKDKIASTFNAADGTLLKLVRIQQQDSTAGRLGMESMLNTFLNEMYQTSEYLQNLASGVRSALYEAEALTDAASAMELEYQVQKWIGSLFSVGMSDTAVNNIASAFGQIASGNISGLGSSGAGNLMIMAANQSGKSIAEILANGIDESSTNELLQEMVNYMAQLYKQSDSRVVQQQIAAVFGLTASDLKAAVNLASSVSTVSASTLSYAEAIGQLEYMANSMYSRTSMGEIMGNAMSNISYSMAAGIANNPALYAIYSMANILDDVVGGIPLPFISAFGTGFDLNTSVADLMLVAALSGGIFSSVAQMIKAGGNGGLTGLGLLKGMGISSGLSTVSRGSGTVSRGTTLSESGSMVGNASGEDIQNKTINDANSSGNEQVASAQESEDSDIPNKTLNTNIVKIYDLLAGIVTGGAMIVKVKDYGLTGWN